MRASSHWNNLCREELDSSMLGTSRIWLGRVLDCLVSAMLLPLKVGPDMLEAPSSLEGRFYIKKVVGDPTKTFLCICLYFMVLP